jgi:hypothetical protein
MSDEQNTRYTPRSTHASTTAATHVAERGMSHMPEWTGVQAAYDSLKQFRVGDNAWEGNNNVNLPAPVTFTTSMNSQDAC